MPPQTVAELAAEATVDFDEKYSVKSWLHVAEDYLKKVLLTTITTLLMHCRVKWRI